MLVPWLVLAAAGDAVDAPPGNAGADAPLDRMALAYSAPPECPGDEAFRREVRDRASGDWEARPGELARRITVSVKPSGERYVASIEFLNAQGERITRTLSGTVCADVVNGIALVTALAIQSRVEEALARSEPEPPKPPPAAPPPKPPPITTRAPDTAVKPREAHVRFGAAARVASGTGPDASFGPAVFGAVEWQRLRVGAAFGALWSGHVTTNGVTAQYRRLSGRVDGCPYVFESRAFAFEPCAFFEAGALHGEGVPGAVLASASSGAAPWLVPGVLLRLVAGFGPMLVVFEAAGGPPLLHERFGLTVDGQEHTTFRVPGFVFDGALGLGVRL